MALLVHVPTTSPPVYDRSRAIRPGWSNERRGTSRKNFLIVAYE